MQQDKIRKWKLETIMATRNAARECTTVGESDPIPRLASQIPAVSQFNLACVRTNNALKAQLDSPHPFSFF